MRRKAGATRLDHRKKVRPKNIHAVILGRKGGVVGGPARAGRLSAERRSKIASMGGHARHKGD